MSYLIREKMVAARFFYDGNEVLGMGEKADGNKLFRLLKLHFTNVKAEKVEEEEIERSQCFSFADIEENLREGLEQFY